MSFRLLCFVHGSSSQIGISRRTLPHYLRGNTGGKIFSDRGARRERNFIPEIASKECWNCKECFSLCPTEALRADYLLTEPLAFPPPSFEPELEE